MGRRTTKELRKPKRLGEKLVTIRRHLQLSQNELIRRLGFTDELVREEISAFERNVRTPPLIVLLEIARAVNTTLETLIDDQLDLELTGKLEPPTSKKRVAEKRTSRN